MLHKKYPISDNESMSDTEETDEENLLPQYRKQGSEDEKDEKDLGESDEGESDIEDIDADLGVTKDDEVEELGEEEENEIDEYDPIAPKTVTKFHKRTIVIADEKRRTSDIINKTEMTELTSERASQISINPIVFTNVEGLTNPIDMARKEFNDRKCPLILRRKIGERFDRDVGILTEFLEFWNPNLMAHAFTYIVVSTSIKQTNGKAKKNQILSAKQI